jgi:hypothetical protein
MLIHPGPTRGFTQHWRLTSLLIAAQILHSSINQRANNRKIIRQRLELMFPLLVDEKGSLFAVVLQSIQADRLWTWFGLWFRLLRVILRMSDLVTILFSVNYILGL